VRIVPRTGEIERGDSGEVVEFIEESKIGKIVRPVIREIERELLNNRSLSKGWWKGM